MICEYIFLQLPLISICPINSLIWIYTDSWVRLCLHSDAVSSANIFVWIRFLIGIDEVNDVYKICLEEQRLLLDDTNLKLFRFYVNTYNPLNNFLTGRTHETYLWKRQNNTFFPQMSFYCVYGFVRLFSSIIIKQQTYSSTWFYIYIILHCLRSDSNQRNLAY